MPIKIEDLLKSSRDYKDKLFDPQKTIKISMAALARLKPPFSLRFKRIDYLDRLGIPVYHCKIDEITKRSYPKDWIFTHKSYGKGKYLIQSRASALMELLERFSCYSFLRDERNFLIIPSNRIKDKAASENLRLSLPKKFRRDSLLWSELDAAPLKWVKSFSLTRNKDTLFPIDWFCRTTTGFAAGNCVEEAILQGLCECIERHVILTFIERRLNAPSININSIYDAEAKKIISKLTRAGVKLFIKDFSFGFGIPSVGILAYDSKGPEPVRIYCAAGTSLNRDIAMIRALTEVAQHRAQSLFEKAALSNTFGFPEYKSLKEAKKFTDTKKTISFSELPTYSNANFRIEVETAVKKMKDMGFEVIVTDTTHPVLRIPAVIIAVPGMEIPNLFDDPYLQLKEYYSSINNYSKASDILKIYFRSCPSKKNDKDLLFNLGFQYEKLKKFNNAVKAYKRIISLSNKRDRYTLIDTYQALLRCYLTLKKSRDVFIIHQKLKRLNS